MNALLQKDVPWVWGVMVAGMVAMVLALFTSSFLYTFVVTPRHYEELFHTAWPSGLLLGVVAACFDEALRTREFLAQRPVSVRAIAGSRFVACGIVLAAWFVGVPFFAYVAFVFDRHWEIGHWQLLPSIWATMTPAVSGCAIGLAAGSLPFVWWGRLVCLGALFLAPFSVIYWLERGSGRVWSSLPTFVGGHLAVAVAALGIAFAAALTRRDPDRPLAATTRTRVVAPLLAVFAVLMAVTCGLCADECIGRLHAAYPDPVAHDGRIVLSVRDKVWNRHVVDEQHVPTGERLASIARREVDNQATWRQPDFFRIENPRWQAAQGSGLGLDGSLLAEPDGRVLWCPPLRGSLRWVVKPDGSAFASGSRVCGRSASGQLGIVEPRGDGVWAFDAERVAVRHLPLPDGDRVQGVTDVHRPDEVVGAPAGFEFLAYEPVVQGERGLYALRAGELVAAGAIAPREEPRNRNWPGRFDDPDRLTWTLVFDGADGVAPFRHTFTPRTFRERCLAGVALATSVLGPPVLQVATAVAPAGAALRVPGPGEGPRWWWLFDPLVAGGRRIWLVLAAIACAGLLAWRVRARLRRIGADAAAIRFWTIATLLLGPVGAVASGVCERKRAWADRRVPIPAPRPRIATLEPEETLA